MGSSLRLVDVSYAEDGSEIETDIAVLRPVNLAATDPIICQTFDLGAPAVREVTQERADFNGNIDLSSFTGPRTFTAELTLMDCPSADKEETLDVLQAASHPSRRIWVYVQRKHWTEERRMQLVPHPFSMVSAPDNSNFFKCSLAFVAPRGLLEGTTVHNNLINPTTEHHGIALPVKWKSPAQLPAPASRIDGDHGGGVSFTSGTSLSSIDAYNEGTVPTSPHFMIYGPCKDPVIINTTTVQRLAFTNIDIPSGDWLDVDVDSRSVLMGSDTKRNYYSSVDWTVSSWFNLAVGTNLVQFEATTTGNGCQLKMDWRSLWL